MIFFFLQIVTIAALIPSFRAGDDAGVALRGDVELLRKAVL